MAGWNLRHGIETAEWMRQHRPDHWRDLAPRLHLADDELSTWSHLAEAMFTIFNPKTLLYEQFAGYYEKEPIDLKKFEPRTAAMDVILGHERINQTNVVKQADVLMALYLLWDQLPADVRLANFRYYEPRTGHGSSLSPSMHALLAARLGEENLARQYLKQAAEIDLGNNMGNAAGGVHAAAIGGLWQSVVFGFAGLQTHANGLNFNPHLLAHWRRLSFPFQWRGRGLRVSIGHKDIEVSLAGEQPLLVRVGASSETFIPGHRYVADYGSSGWGPWRRAD
jgi:kojibiose phosphorylase